MTTFLQYQKKSLTMNESETFGAEKEYAEMVIAWMNEEAKKRKVKFEARLTDIQLQLKILEPLRCFHGWEM